MGRPVKHSADEILDATRNLIVVNGPRSSGVAAITKLTGAPVGSLYHRYGSRNQLIVMLWLRTVRRFQAGFLAAGQHDRAFEAALGMAMWTFDFAAEHDVDARLLLNYSCQDLLDAGLTQELEQELNEANVPIVDALAKLAERFCGHPDRGYMESLAQALIDLPYATVRRHLTASRKLSPEIRLRLKINVTAILKGVQRETNQQCA